jgi:hypothetical protein
MMRLALAATPRNRIVNWVGRESHFRAVDHELERSDASWVDHLFGAGVESGSETSLLGV